MDNPGAAGTNLSLTNTAFTLFSNSFPAEHRSNPLDLTGLTNRDAEGLQETIATTIEDPYNAVILRWQGGYPLVVSARRALWTWSPTVRHRGRRHEQVHDLHDSLGVALSAATFTGMYSGH